MTRCDFKKHRECSCTTRCPHDPETIKAVRPDMILRPTLSDIMACAAFILVITGIVFSMMHADEFFKHDNRRNQEITRR